MSSRIQLDESARLWSAILASVRSRWAEIYRTWFEEIPHGEFVNGELIITLDDPVRSAYLRNDCHEALLDAIMTVTGLILPVRIICTSDDRTLASSMPPMVTRLPLSADYTFEQFVIGPSNRMAHAATRAVCSRPGKQYNPLFIYGPSGLGKTHLLQATCFDLAEQTSERGVLYVTCESFVSDFVRAIRDNNLPAFQSAVRAADAIVIDDVQFLSDREGSQDEFFHTFNTLHTNGRQIVLSADVPPTEIPTLEDRLTSRFSWGLVVKIDPPDRETRSAILAKKAALRGVDAPPEALDYVAERVASNVRSLEGALKNLILESSASGEPITLDLARRLFGGTSGPARLVPIEEIIESVCTHFSVRRIDLVGRRRSRSISLPRQIAMYLARRLTSMSLEEIGSHFSSRDHTTVMHAERTIAQECNLNKLIAETVAVLTTKLTSRADDSRKRWPAVGADLS